MNKRRLITKRDRADDRDILFRPQIVSVPRQITIADCKKQRMRVLDQGQEGACTGFGLAATIHYAMKRAWGKIDPVSPWMLYHFAKQYDPWPGEDYDGSTCRGALKGWHKNGVLPAAKWGRTRSKELSQRERFIASDYPLGVYARVAARNLRDIQIAIHQCGAVFASCNVHAGWDDVSKSDPMIRQSSDRDGGHAFAVVGYVREGFVIQNSWGKSWGDDGLAILDYRDWLTAEPDVWAISLGAPILEVVM